MYECKLKIFCKGFLHLQVVNCPEYSQKGNFFAERSRYKKAEGSWDLYNQRNPDDHKTGTVQCEGALRGQSGQD